MKTIETNLIEISKEQFIKLVAKKAINSTSRYQKSLHQLWDKVVDIVRYDANNVLQRFLMVKSDMHTFVSGNYIENEAELVNYASQIDSLMFTNSIRLQKGANNYNHIIDMAKKINTVERLFKRNFDFEQLSDWERRLLDTVLKLFVINNNWLKVLRGELVLEYDEEMIQELISYIERDWFQDSCFNLIEDLINLVKSKKISLVDYEEFKQNLLNQEKLRSDIEPYEEKILKDPNRGHWDLWNNQYDGKYFIEVEEKFIARNPEYDINDNGVIAIDFGTKSTIVVYQSDIDHSLPMGIGDGNLKKEPTPKRYENPTVMHLVNLESFLQKYHEEKGRPTTKWEDLTISHTAVDQFGNSKSEEYFEFLQQIKQWCNQRQKQVRVKSHMGQSYVLPAFMDLKEEDWNPIEIYAYYIGLYINNMRHGIFMDYYLSFPVTYEKAVREKIIGCFTKGLKKSLPDVILENEEIMKRFHVNGDISEPAAYAVCALQEYGFEPEDGEEIFYGIFDFGGGTTDFDFGLWSCSKRKRYDYTIENFGAGGDEYLGGENLLAMLAFEIFKENQKMMRENGYTFTLAPKCTEFLGSDALLSDSQEAEKNMKNMMEKLRPYWEGKIGENVADEKIRNIAIQELIVLLKNIIKDKSYEIVLKKELDDLEHKHLEGKIQELEVREAIKNANKKYGFLGDEDNNIEFNLTLFDKEGVDHLVNIQFEKKKLIALIEERIQDGINNFMSALQLTYQEDRVLKPSKINIFLAGNSCKSPIVKRLFEKTIAEKEREIQDRYQIKGCGQLFELFPPLGTEEAYLKQESMGLSPKRNDFERPTGKTGVAFGLIQCRVGGGIERVSKVGHQSEIPFQYFIGTKYRKRFVPFKDKEKGTKEIGKPDYNVWYSFVEADEPMFELYYTSLPECTTNELMVEGNSGVNRLRCYIETDPDAFVFIRAVDPKTIEYVVAKNHNVEESKIGEIVRKVLEKV